MPVKAGGFSLNDADCGYFDIDTVLRPGFDMTPGHSASASQTYPLWARFTSA